MAGRIHRLRHAARSALTRRYHSGRRRIGASVTTGHRRVKHRIKRLGNLGRLVRGHGLWRLRTMPVESLAARGVDTLFGGAEGYLHGKVAHHMGKLEEIGASKLGMAQSYAAARAMHGARKLHRRYIRQPGTVGDVHQMKGELAHFQERLREGRAGLMDLTTLSSKRKLRRGHVPKKVDFAARSLLSQLQHSGQLHDLLQGGPAAQKALRESAARVGLKDTHELDRIHKHAKHVFRNWMGGGD